MTPRLKIAIVEDHGFWRQTLADLITNDLKLELAVTSKNGLDFIKQFEALSPELRPEMIITDLSMPIMGGLQLSKWVLQNHPHIKVIVLTQQHELATTIQLIRTGVKGFLNKNITPDILSLAINGVLRHEYYFAESWSDSQNPGRSPRPLSESAFMLLAKWNSLNEKEKLFVSQCCSERSFKEIAAQMNASMDTIEVIRSKIFSLFEVTGRIGLVTLIIQNRLLEP